MELLIGILLVYGLTNIICNGSIFDPLKNKIEEIMINKKSSLCKWILKLINCPMCLGFWIGAICGFFVGPFVWFNIIWNGGLYSGTTWILFCITQYLGQGNDPSKTHNIIFQNNLDIKEQNEK